jgi:DNA-binding CsgD family transcriptional regulator
MTSTNTTLLPRPLTIPEWKKYFSDKYVEREMIANHAVDQLAPSVINKVLEIGHHYEMVIDYRDGRVIFIRGFEEVLGISPDILTKGKFEFLVSLVHPDDVEKVLGLSVHYYKFIESQPMDKRLSFKASLNFRMKKSDGTYIKVLEQVVFLAKDETGKITHGFKHFTDISHFHYSNEVVLAVLDDDKDAQRQQLYTFNLEKKVMEGINAKDVRVFSERELEILTLIRDGKSSKEIAVELKISQFTVNKHRENMMRKTECKNMNEVISFAYCNNYL